METSLEEKKKSHKSSVLTFGTGMNVEKQRRVWRQRGSPGFEPGCLKGC